MEAAERRQALRVPVRGVAVLHPDQGPLHATLENLSQGGALLTVASGSHEVGPAVDVELRLPAGGGWVTARTVRAERLVKRWRIALAFDRVDPAMRAAIDQTISAALAAAQRRPILVIDDRSERRSSLIKELAERGMTPLAPRTPLEAIELLARSQLHVDVCLLAPGFGVPTTDLVAVLADSFPWVTTAEISDDLEATATRALETWSATPVARLAS
jgi:hypothetical protein